MPDYPASYDELVSRINSRYNAVLAELTAAHDYYQALMGGRLNPGLAGTIMRLEAEHASVMGKLEEMRPASESVEPAGNYAKGPCLASIVL